MLLICLYVSLYIILLFTFLKIIKLENYIAAFILIETVSVKLYVLSYSISRIYWSREYLPVFYFWPCISTLIKTFESSKFRIMFKAIRICRHIKYSTGSKRFEVFRISSSDTSPCKVERRTPTIFFDYTPIIIPDDDNLHLFQTFVDIRRISIAATRWNASVHRVVRVWHDLTAEQSDDFAGGLSRL